MLSIDFIRKNKQKVINAAKNKGREVDIDRILVLDSKRLELIRKIQLIREERNTISKKEITDEIKKHGKEIKEELKKQESELKNVEKELYNLISHVPNIPLNDVPLGKENKEIKKWGNIPQFDFKPKSHIELGKMLDIIDLERGSKVSGFRGYFLKNEVASLHIALLFYAFQKLIKKGYVPFIAPSIVRGFSLFGSGQFPWGKQEVYNLSEDTYLAGTSESPMMAYHANEILDEKELPKKYVAFSPCFRKEAGAYGKDTKGIYRRHEFLKVEQIILCKNNLEQAKVLFDELQDNCEEILQELELPYKVMLMSMQDMGEPQIIKYDTEVWMPSRNNYGETTSNSIMGDFQTRRLKIKYRMKDKSTKYCFSLNNTAIASPRILIPLLENYQQKDGSINVPKVLQNLVGFNKILPKQ